MTNISPLTGGLLKIHKIITRALYLSIKKCDEYSIIRKIPQGNIEGFVMYVESLKRVTHAHHLSEEEIIFPYFRDSIDAPYNRLQDDHNALARILDQFDQSLREVSSDGVGKLRNVLAEFEKVWEPHIKIEEQNFTTSKLEPVIGMNEQMSLLEKLAEHGMKNTGKGPLTVPFMFYNLDGKDRDEFMNGFPWMVRKVLVPVLWKPQWKPMIPYLL